MELTPATRICPHADVVWREVDGEVVLLNVTSGQYYSLDEVGSRVWSLVPAEGVSLADLRERLLAEFDGTPEQIDRDLQQLCAGLHAADLLTIL